MYIYIYIHVFVYVDVYIYICICIYIYIYMYNVYSMYISCPVFPRGAYTAPAGRAAQGGRVGQRRLLDAGHGFLMG